MGLEIVPFHEELLPAAAELLARRHARDRATMPLLPVRFEAVRTALAAVRDVWHKPWSSGAAATRDGRLIGYLIGEARFDTLRGRHVWMHLAGHALVEDAPPDLYADLYAAAGPPWLRLGAFDHYVLMPVGDRAGLDAWFALSFGQEQAHALRSLDEPLPELVDLPGARIRRATETDRDALVEEMSPILRRHLAGPPVWGVALPEYVWPMRQGFAEMLDDESIHVWLAEEMGSGGEGQGRILGYQTYYPALPADDNLTISISERTVLLEVAATLPEARGRGIGRALTAAGLADAKSGGYRICIADWRTTNIEAARFWPGLGFRPAVYRLTRKVDPRIIWADH
jgi:ribosomal protein S18 acetylase RimI-like enzyme